MNNSEPPGRQTASGTAFCDGNIILRYKNARGISRIQGHSRLRLISHRVKKTALRKTLGARHGNLAHQGRVSDLLKLGLEVSKRLLIEDAELD